MIWRKQRSKVELACKNENLPQMPQPTLSLLLSFIVSQSSKSRYQLHFPRVDVVTGRERQWDTVSLFCHPPTPPLPLPGPWAQPINHCCLIQHEEKFSDGAQRWHHRRGILWISPFSAASLTNRGALYWFEPELNSSEFVTLKERVHGNIHITHTHRSSLPFVLEVGKESDT